MRCWLTIFAREGLAGFGERRASVKGAFSERRASVKGRMVGLTAGQLCLQVLDQHLSATQNAWHHKVVQVRPVSGFIPPSRGRMA